MKSSNITPTKVAIVTGASSGIGLATAKTLAQAGYEVFGFSRRALSDQPGITFIAVDVRKPDTIAAGVQHVLDARGRISLLVNNAGIFLLGAAEESSTEQAREIFETNFFGLVEVTNAVLPIMRQQRAGRIINISSILGLIPSVYMAIYGASKHAVEGYTESLDHEVRTMGVRALLVEPGFTRTNLGSHSQQPDRLQTDYDPVRNRVTKLVDQSIQSGDAPSVVAQTVLRAATDKRPKLRYPAGPKAKQLALLRRFVPAAAFDKSFRKQFQLDLAPTA